MGDSDESTRLLTARRRIFSDTFRASSEDDRPFGDYELLGEIARGGMGIVYRARQRSLNRLVALKVIRDGRARLRTTHDGSGTRPSWSPTSTIPHIVPIYEVGEHRGRRFFSMKLSRGAAWPTARRSHRRTPRARPG